jgi:hypothetical protein
VRWAGASSAARAICLDGRTLLHIIIEWNLVYFVFPSNEIWKSFHGCTICVLKLLQEWFVDLLYPYPILRAKISFYFFRLPLANSMNVETLSVYLQPFYFICDTCGGLFKVNWIATDPNLKTSLLSLLFYILIKIYLHLFFVWLSLN